ncbi:hypothetical protein JOC85_003819 [Bacillus mesophilus]|uniref:Lipoprotein n=1 Tax=Bacillus mesophilus TaxID=1808955 RepID=A0A6M0QBH8_9BACI|nr:hypothetical protein [Bacillus mesophilus]MBM7662993.1 hypothetical protein [Bacillus mesophilus]NEY73683.1 hypothetical protein [Bacillus mesophilus]
MRKPSILSIFILIGLTACGTTNGNTIKNDEDQTNYNPVRYEGINGEMDNPNDGYGNFLMSDPNDPATDRANIVPDPNPFDETDQTQD